MNLDNIRDDFPIFKNRKMSYLDSAATTQKPHEVIDKIKEFYENNNASPHRGAYRLSIESTNIYEMARKKVKQFINARDSKEIIFTKNATEAINLVAYSYGLENVNKGENVVISIMEHHSNLVPWQMVTKAKDASLKYIYLNEDYELDYDSLDRVINKNTKIVAITHVSNVTGTINDIEKIIKCAHKNGAVVIVDASQSIQHMKVDVSALDADFLVFSGHKMVSPLGIGVLYGKKELLSKMKPFLLGGDMIEYVYEQTTTFASLPNRFEAGTQNVAGAYGLMSAIEYLEKVGLDNILKKEEEILEYAKKKMSELDFIETYIPGKNHASIISFNIKGVHPHDVASILDSENICIRSGNHCAQPLLRYLKIDSTCRSSFYFYNTKDDVDKLIDGLKKAYEMFKKYIKI